MKAVERILWLLGLSVLVVDGIYLCWSLAAADFEVIGVITMGLSGILCLFLAFYFRRTLHAYSGALPEDRDDADIDDGDPEVGFFTPYSWWPILLAAACTMTFLGLAVSAWIWIFSIPFVAITLIGWVYENYRGHYSH